MNTKEKKKIMNIVWAITDVIILICSILLLIEGGTQQTIIGIIGLLVVIAEVILYKKGRILQ